MAPAYDLFGYFIDISYDFCIGFLWRRCLYVRRAVIGRNRGEWLNVLGKPMDEVFGWLVYRYESSDAMREGSAFWGWIASASIGFGLFPLLVGLALSSKESRVALAMMDQIPSWAPAAAYWVTVLGLISGAYSLLLLWAARKAKRVWSL